MKVTIAALDKKGNNAPAAVLGALKTLNFQDSESFGVATPFRVVVKKTINDLRKQDMSSSTAIGFAYSNPVVHKKQYCVKLDNGVFIFDGRIYPDTAQADITEEIVKKLNEQSYIKTSTALLEKIDGDFSFHLISSEQIMAGRDAIGVQPLYFGENTNLFAIASNRKALWRLSIDETQSFPPGNISVASREGFKFKPVKKIELSRPKVASMQEAAVKLQKLLESSVQKRVSGIREVAVAFSGGLDSSVIAFLLSKYNLKVHLFHVSLKDRAETEEAKRAAEDLKLPLHIHLFEESDVEKVLSKVVELSEEADPVKASIGVPFYWIAEKTAEAGFKILFAGQGADELFGGYQRYVNEYLKHGAEKAKKMMYEDIIRIHEGNIERDVKICDYHGVELRLPFMSYKLVKFVVSLPLELRMEKNPDTKRKLILRKVARDMYLPRSITEKPKKALQYATGTNDALKKIAKKRNTTVREYISQIYINERNRT